MAKQAHKIGLEGESPLIPKSKRYAVLITAFTALLDPLHQGPLLALTLV